MMVLSQSFPPYSVTSTRIGVPVGNGFWEAARVTSDHEQPAAPDSSAAAPTTPDARRKPRRVRPSRGRRGSYGTFMSHHQVVGADQRGRDELCGLPLGQRQRVERARGELVEGERLRAWWPPRWTTTRRPRATPRRSADRTVPGRACAARLRPVERWRPWQGWRAYAWLLPTTPPAKPRGFLPRRRTPDPGGSRRSRPWSPGRIRTRPPAGSGRRRTAHHRLPAGATSASRGSEGASAPRGSRRPASVA